MPANIIFRSARRRSIPAKSKVFQRNQNRPGPTAEVPALGTPPALAPPSLGDSDVNTAAITAAVTTVLKPDLMTLTLHQQSLQL